MAIKWIATITDPSWSLIEEQEFIGSADITEAYFQFGWIKPYNDANPRPPKGLAIYEPLMEYENDRLVLKDNGFYLSNVGNGNKTASIWNPLEWIVKLQGVI